MTRQDGVSGGVWTHLRDWAVAFGSFWYGFIIGDDWRIAVTVVLGLAAVWGLRQGGVPAWWLMPVLVLAVIYVSLLLKSRGRSPSR